MRKQKDFSGPFMKLKLDKKLLENEMNIVRKGKIPVDMDDRWLICYKESVLYFYRSWTGNCIYKVKIDEGRLVEVQINADKEIYNITDEKTELNFFYELLELFLESKI